MKKNKKKDFWFLKTIIFGIALGLTLRHFFVIAFIPTESMSPTLSAKSVHVFVRNFEEPKTGDIVLIAGETRLAKRVIATDGQTVTIQDGKVYVDDVLLREDYLPAGTVTDGDGVYHVPDGELFYMGDNRSNSYDSRGAGTVDLSSVPYVLLF